MEATHAITKKSVCVSVVHSSDFINRRNTEKAKKGSRINNRTGRYLRSSARTENSAIEFVREAKVYSNFKREIQRLKVSELTSRAFRLYRSS